MIKVLADALLPPFNFLLLATIGALIVRWRPRFGRTLMIVSLVSGYVVCTSAITGNCLRYLEHRPAAGRAMAMPTVDAADSAAIVVLGAGSYFNAPEYGRDTVSRSTLERLRWAARLHRELQIPIVVSGGSPCGNRRSEAEQMRDVLTEDFAVPVQWMETRSRNTYESAQLTRALFGTRYAQILLVTHAAHMGRAALVYRNVGFNVVPSATGFTTSSPTSIHDFLPSASGLTMGRVFFHEIMGIGWYHLRIAFGK